MSTTPDSTDGRRRRSSLPVRFAVAFLVGVLGVLAVGVGALYAMDRQYDGRVLPGVHVGGVDLSGLAPADARARLEARFTTLGQGHIVLTGPDGPHAIDYSSIDRHADVDSMLAAALSAGRDGDLLGRWVGNARTALRGVDLAPTVTYDPTKLESAIDQIAQGLRRDPVDATFTKTKSGFTVTQSQPGVVVDTTALVGQIDSVVGSLGAPAEVTAPLPVQTVEPALTTDEAKAATQTVDRMVANVTLRSGGESWTIPTSKLRPLVTLRPTVDGGVTPIVDVAKITPLVKDVAEQVRTEPANATFVVKGSKITGVRPSHDGRSLPVGATSKLVYNELLARRDGKDGGVIAPRIATLTANFTTAEAKAAAPRMKALPHGTWTTHFPIGPKNGFGANIWLPARIIDGTVVGPGETFDFWKVVGPVSRARGFKQGGAIINGHTEPQGALAGGICSCSTTFFNAALRAGYQMGARRNHFYYIDRYPLGLDATVFISSGGATQTMSWTNDTPYPVLVRGSGFRSGGTGFIKVQLYSVPNGRRVSFSRPVVRNVTHASDSVVRTGSLPAGATQRVEVPVDGMDVTVSRTVRDAKGHVIHRDTYYSHYSRVTGVLLVGTGRGGA
ncbi:MAG: VanW family protein [Chloroflexota bacterium]